MKLIQVEHAVAMIRAYLIECTLQDDWSDDRVAEVTEAIGLYVRRIAEAAVASGPTVDRRLPRATLRQAAQFVNDHLDTKLKWDEIAAAVGMDRYVFGRRFKLSTGMTPHDYVVRCRLRRAMKLLSQTDRSIVDIALDVGCACQSHFTTMFRKCTGTTPAAFRSLAMARNSAGARVAPFRGTRGAEPLRFPAGNLAHAAPSPA